MNFFYARTRKENRIATSHRISKIVIQFLGPIYLTYFFIFFLHTIVCKMIKRSPILRYIVFMCMCVCVWWIKFGLGVGNFLEDLVVSFCCRFVQASIVLSPLHILKYITYIWTNSNDSNQANWKYNKCSHLIGYNDDEQYTPVKIKKSKTLRNTDSLS